MNEHADLVGDRLDPEATLPPLTDDTAPNKGEVVNPLEPPNTGKPTLHGDTE